MHVSMRSCMGGFGGRARSNIALFYNDITDLQVANFDGLAFSILNAPEAEVYGAEIENQFVLSDALTLDISATWLPEASFGESEALSADALGTVSLSGRDFAQAPELTANVALSFDQPIGRDLSLSGRVAAYYSGEQFTNPANNEKRDAQTEYAATLALSSASTGLSVSLWCQNCSDERYVTQHFPRLWLRDTTARGRNCPTFWQAGLGDSREKRPVHVMHQPYVM